jgi:hypothetical protein
MGVLAVDGVWRERVLASRPSVVCSARQLREGLEEARRGLPQADARSSGAPRERAAEHARVRALHDPLAPARARTLGPPSGDAGLEREGVRGRRRRWLVDFGARRLSARAPRRERVAVMHYFAAREAADPAGAGPLTWPEGNGRLVGWLAARAAGHVHAGAAVHRVERAGGGAAAPMRVLAGDTEWLCDAVVWAAPTFVAAHVVDGAPRTPWRYAPWLVANVTLARRPDGGADPTATRPRRGTT